MIRGVRVIGVSLVVGLAVALLPASAGAANLAFNPTSLDFGNHAVGTSSTLTTRLTVSCDSGCMTIPPTESYSPNLLGVAPDDYSQTNDCDQPINVVPFGPASCTITVTFKPLANGVINGAIYDAGGTGPRVSLSGSAGPLQSATTAKKCKKKKKKKKKHAGKSKKKKKKKCKKKKKKKKGKKK